TSRGHRAQKTRSSADARHFHQPSETGRLALHTTERSIAMGIQSINARNQFRGRIKEIILGPVLSEVDVDAPAGTVTSVITTRSGKELELQVRTGVLAFGAATAVAVANR